MRAERGNNMKRIIPAILASLLLTACGTDKDFENDKITKSNLRAAFAEATASYIADGKVNPDGYVISIAGEAGNALDMSGLNFSCTDKDLLKKLDSAAGSKVTVTFETSDGKEWIMKER